MKNRIISFLEEYKLSLISVIAFFILWEIVSRLKLIDPLFISSPSKVLLAGYELVKTGEIFPHLVISLEALLLGFVLVTIFGIAAGLIVSSSKRLYEILRPFIFALNSTPTVAVIPLIIVWFGIGFSAKVAVVFLMGLKPILINTMDGVKNTDLKLIKMAKSFGAEPLFILKSITLFSALPFVFSGLRIAIGRGIVGLVVGEALGYGKGIGYLVSFYSTTFQTARLMFVVLILLIINSVAVNLIAAAEKRVVKWKG